MHLSLAVGRWCVSNWFEIQEAESRASLGKVRPSGQVAVPGVGEGVTSTFGRRRDQAGRGPSTIGWENVDEATAWELVVWISESCSIEEVSGGSE